MMVEVRIYCRIGDILRPALQTMLADHNGPALARFNILGNEQNTVGVHTRPHIQFDLVPSKFGLVIDQSCPRIGWNIRRWQTANYFIPNIVAIKFGALRPAFWRRGVRL